jgi:hypothetical protein
MLFFGSISSCPKVTIQYVFFLGFFFIKKFEETFDTKLIFILESIIEPKEIFEFIDVPLPACFDLSKPYQSVSSNNSLHVNMFYFFI